MVYLYLFSGCKCLKVANTQERPCQKRFPLYPTNKVSIKMWLPRSLEVVQYFLLCTRRIVLKTCSGDCGGARCPFEFQNVRRWTQRRHDSGEQMFCTTPLSIFRRLLSSSVLLYRYTWFQFPPNSFSWPIHLHKLLQSLESFYRLLCKPSVRHESASTKFDRNRRGSSVAKWTSIYLFCWVIHCRMCTRWDTRTLLCTCVLMNIWWIVGSPMSTMSHKRLDTKSALTFVLCLWWLYIVGWHFRRWNNERRPLFIPQWGHLYYYSSK